MSRSAVSYLSESGVIDDAWNPHPLKQSKARYPSMQIAVTPGPISSQPAMYDPSVARRMKVPPDVAATSHRHSTTASRPLDRRKGQEGMGEMGHESIPHLREAIQSLEDRMATLMNARDMLESRLEQAVRLQSPIQRLPSELLASIFVIGALDMEEEAPLMLSTMLLVCRHWANVALDTPVLWSRLVLHNHNSIERAKLKLRRSKSVPLDICIDFNPRLEPGSHVTQNIVHAMDILQPSMHRWRSFSLVVSNRPQAHAALMRCKEAAPLLEVLSIRVLHSMQDDHYSSPPLPLFDGQTLRLRSCSFTSFNFGWDRRLVSGLRVLKLGGYWNGFSPSVRNILDILRACPQLEELALRNMSDFESEPSRSFEEMPAGRDAYVDDVFVAAPADRATIHLPRLTKASFYYSGILRTQTILSQLIFPALEKLELCYLDDVTPVLKYLTRQSLTSLPMRSLRIESSFFNELKLVMFLRRLPALTTLELVDTEDVSSNLLKGLSTPASAQTWICPKLEKLDLAGCTTLDWDSLRTFVESRLPPQSRAFPRQHISPCPSSSSSPSSACIPLPPSTITSSASAQALLHVPRSGATVVRPVNGAGVLWPRRLRSIDLTRCHQIGKEMVQWLRVYIPEVRCEVVRGEGLWAER